MGLKRCQRAVLRGDRLRHVPKDQCFGGRQDEQHGKDEVLRIRRISNQGAPPQAAAAKPMKAVMLFNTGPRLRSVSMIAAPSVAVARPVAKPCTTRATINAAANPPK